MLGLDNSQSMRIIRGLGDNAFICNSDYLSRPTPSWRSQRSCLLTAISIQAGYNEKNTKMRLCNGIQLPTTTFRCPFPPSTGVEQYGPNTQAKAKYYIKNYWRPTECNVVLDILSLLLWSRIIPSSVIQLGFWSHQHLCISEDLWLTIKVDSIITRISLPWTTGRMISLAQQFQLDRALLSSANASNCLIITYEGGNYQIISKHNHHSNLGDLT